MAVKFVSDMAETAGEGAQGGPYFNKERAKCSPEEEAKLERQHFWRIIDAFRFYRYNKNTSNKVVDTIRGGLFQMNDYVSKQQ